MHTCVDSATDTKKQVLGHHDSHHLVSTKMRSSADTYCHIRNQLYVACDNIMFIALIKNKE